MSVSRSPEVGSIGPLFEPAADRLDREFEWRVIQPLLPNKPRGVPRVDDRPVLNGIFWMLRSEHYGATCQSAMDRTPRPTMGSRWPLIKDLSLVTIARLQRSRQEQVGLNASALAYGAR